MPVADLWTSLTTATQHLPAPLATLHAPSLRANAADLARRADGLPIRVASKSVRVRRVLEGVLHRPGFRGILAYTLPEALWLAEWCDDVVVAYPSVDLPALRRLGADADLARRVTVMVDSPAQLDLIEAAAGPGAHPIRVCLEFDVSYDLPGLRVGVWRSPVRTPADARAAARDIARRRAVTLVGMMAYEAQIAGLGDIPVGPIPARLRTLAIRGLQRLSWRELVARRAEAVAAVREIAELEFVNGGGSGSVQATASDPSITEVAAGSGLFGPHLFDHYRSFSPQPAAAFCLPVVRKPSARRATLLGGGWIASGPPGLDRQPSPVWPPGLKLVPNEGAGEVQTPVAGPGAAALQVGDRVWFRHAKAGELSEHVNRYLLVDGDAVVDELFTYRGEGKDFL